MQKLVYQFKITLQHTDPPIWRRIQVPGEYSFWDLHVALQDAMGWLDYHLHAFRPSDKKQRRELEIGIPTDGDDVLPGWEIAINRLFVVPGDSMHYEYDFGDGWEHDVLLEGIFLREKGAKYPRCAGGERAAPPEDCGGIPGYYRMLEVLEDKTSDEYREMTAWLRGHDRKYHPYDPNKFSPEQVKFSNPKKRWEAAFGRGTWR